MTEVHFDTFEILPDRVILNRLYHCVQHSDISLGDMSEYQKVIIGSRDNEIS